MTTAATPSEVAALRVDVASITARNDDLTSNVADLTALLVDARAERDRLRAGIEQLHDDWMSSSDGGFFAARLHDLVENRTPPAWNTPPSPSPTGT